jgi:hypothetical protein
MTTKSVNFAFGRTLENHALMAALYPHKPNPRSPAFALQEIFILLKKVGVLRQPWQLETEISNRIDEVIRDQVTWNDQECHWQVGKGTNVPFNKIAEDAIRWYLNDWDFKRHTRDSEVEYPEDLANFFAEDEFKHLADALLPAKDELTRRIFTSRNNNNFFYYVDVVPLEDNQFAAEYGRFDKPECHQTLETSKNFWELEVSTILPLLRRGKVLSYTIHHITSKRGV